LARALARHLDWPVFVRQLAYRRGCSVVGLLRLESFLGLKSSCSNSLRPPWPRVLVFTNLANEPVARHVRTISKGYTKLVAIGRTWADYDCFDLIVTTSQYRLPARPNILNNPITISDYGHLDSAPVYGAFSEDGPPPPYLAVLLGGRSGPFTFGRRAARRLADMVNELALELGASVLCSTSSRTDLSAAEIFRAGLRVPNRFYRYLPGQYNPYAEIARAADAFVVTGDSIAMLSEAVSTGRPVYIFDLGAGGRSMRQGPASGRVDRTLATEAYHLLMLLGPKRLSRDITQVHSLLVEGGHAVWLGDGVMRSFSPPPSPLPNTLSRIAELI